MSESDFLQVLSMFDKFIEILENPLEGEQINEEAVTKSFQCAHFIELTIAKACELGREEILENNLQQHWNKRQKSISYKHTELRNACDMLLELYMKDNSVSSSTVDEYLRLYTEQFESKRLFEFLKRTLTNGVYSNIVINSLMDIGVPSSVMEDEALKISWESLINSDNQYDVLESIHRMLEDGHITRLVQFLIDLHNDSKVKKLILQVLTNKLSNNDENICLALTSIPRRSLWALLQCDAEFALNLIDTVFYFARHMSQVEGHWLSDYQFEYKHLIKIVKTLLNGPYDISDIIYKRVQVVKTHSNDSIWHSIEQDIGMTECAR